MFNECGQLFLTYNVKVFFYLFWCFIYTRRRTFKETANKQCPWFFSVAKLNLILRMRIFFRKCPQWKKIPLETTRLYFFLYLIQIWKHNQRKSNNFFNTAKWMSRSNLSNKKKLVGFLEENILIIRMLKHFK